jgi:hypothetical protein
MGGVYVKFQINLDKIQTKVIEPGAECRPQDYDLNKKRPSKGWRVEKGALAE